MTSKHTKAMHDHAVALQAFARVSEAEAGAHPEDWFAAIVAKNQRDSAEEALRASAVSEALEAGEILEWRFVGERLRFGSLPLEFLSRLAAPLNSLLVRSAYFARNKAEAMYGAADALSREISLSVVGLAPGSTRLFIKGNAHSDLTGQSAFVDGLEGLFEVLEASNDLSSFYERLDDIGERASEALHDTLKALETEECSLEITWHSAERPRQVRATYEMVVHMRALLDGIGIAEERQERLTGRITLLSVNGRLQLELNDGGKATVRFKPKTQAGMVAALTLNRPVHLDVLARVAQDPISGDEIKRYTLVSLDLPPLLANPQG